MTDTVRGHSLIAHVLEDIARERSRQNAKWGEQNHDDGTWALILGEEFGEVAQAALHDEFGGKAAGTLRSELIQLAAVAVQWIELIDRRTTPLALAERSETATRAIKTADHFGVNGVDTRV